MISTCILVVFAIRFQCVEGAQREDYRLQALLIDRSTSSVFDIPPNTLKKSHCGSWANACPAQRTADKVFVTKNALTQDPLFVKQICSENQTIEAAKFEKFICAEPFKISALFNKINLTFEFGYEVYVSKKNKSKFHKKSKNLFSRSNLRQDYMPIKKALESINEISRKSKRSHRTKQFIRFIFGRNGNFKHDENSKMNFVWINVFEVAFDFEQWTPLRVSYQVRSNSGWPVSFFCKVYDLATGVYEEITISRKYSQPYQERTFSRYVLPDESISAECDNYVCLKQWLLIPIDQFHFSGVKESSCPHMATVPIWKRTLELVVIKIDKFIYALFKAVESGLYVISGISGQLQLTQKREDSVDILDEEIEQNSPIYLDIVNEKMPVPEIIYKLVKYQSDNCPIVGSCWYSAIIVIHNNPYFDPENKICPEVTTEWGWTEVTKFHLPGSMDKPFTSKYVYVCKSEPELLTRLMGSSAEKEVQNMRDFDLSKVFSNSAKGSMHDEPIAGDVFQNLLDLAERERKFRRNALGGIKEDDEDNVDDDSREDGEDAPSRRNQQREGIDVIDEGIEEEDDGEIQLATEDKKMRSHNEEIDDSRLHH